MPENGLMYFGIVPYLGGAGIMLVVLGVGLEFWKAKNSQGKGQSAGPAPRQFVRRLCERSSSTAA